MEYSCPRKEDTPTSEHGLNYTLLASNNYVVNGEEHELH